jgi:N4-gp56 family major capsid protein
MATVATGTPGVAGNLQAEQQTYFAKTLLKQAKYKTVLDQFGYTEKIPAHSSKTISFSQYSDLAVATTPLTEGTPPSETLLTVTPITATIDQLGAYTILTDLAELTTKHPVVTKTNQLLGTQAARTYDRLINATVVAGTSVIYPGAIAARASVTATSYLTMAEIKKGVALLRNNGAEEFDDGNFVCVITPSVEADLMGDSTFRDTVYRQTGKNELYKGGLVSFMGVTFVRSNNIPNLGGVGSAGAVVHTSYLFGKDAFAVTDLQTLQMYKEGPGTTSDPLHQKMTFGWKVGFKSVILNQNFLVRFESASAF